MSLRQLQGVIFSFGQIVLCSTLALSPLVLCALCLLSEQYITDLAVRRITTALPDRVLAPQLIERDHSVLSPHRDASTGHATTLIVHRRHSSHISTQAIAAIAICSTVVFCAFVGCLLQLTAAFSSWRRRARSCTPTDTQSTTTNTAESPDAEMGEQPIPMARHLSPPPPYSRAPSYESSGGSSNTGRRSACAL
ncbi:hypothetical protein EDB92DRAFT_285148 [Lactarius akahatsu]|uniref:Uncharacterized protein n=1 Tax=Lactarius akahatsu TaxID=416441 RepID=A0AAD4LN76_9AGAM|nr:hypothetical protein EDB92DRAFT_285148 [Lactarius akahatsu]